MAYAISYAASTAKTRASWASALHGVFGKQSGNSPGPHAHRASSS